MQSWLAFSFSGCIFHDTAQTRYAYNKKQALLILIFAGLSRLAYIGLGLVMDK